MLVAQCTCKAIEKFARAPRDEKSRNNLGSRQPVHQLNETRRTVPNFLYFERKVAPAIFGP